jgi:hypothetical protein
MLCVFNTIAARETSPGEDAEHSTAIAITPFNDDGPAVHSREIMHESRISLKIVHSSTLE